MGEDSKIYGIIALKGGVGKTTVVSNIGTSLAREFGKKVLLVDANFSTPHLGIHLGMLNPEKNLHPVLNEEYSIYEAIYQHPLGFHIIPGQLSPNLVDPLSLRDKLEPLREIYDVILIDSSPSLNDEMAATMEAADHIIVVSSPDYPTLSSTLHAVSIANQKQVPIRGIVLNKVRNKRFELNQRDVSGASDTRILANLPEDVKVLAALSKMTPVVEYAPKQEISHRYHKLAADLVGEKYNKSVKGKLKKKKVKKKNGKKTST